MDDEPPASLAMQKAGALLTLGAAVALALIAVDILRQRPAAPGAPDGGTDGD